MKDSNSSIPENFPILNLPPAEIKLRHEGRLVKVFDRLRKKYVVLTPEEFVRQSFTSWLYSFLNYPKSLMANEIGINLNGTRKRCDTVVFNSDGSPFIIVEYKAPDVNITQTVFDQIVRYNMVLKANFLIVSNGLQHYCCLIDYKNNSYRFIPRIPEYDEARLLLSSLQKQQFCQ